MNSKQFLESTTSGSVATVATPVGKTQTRGKGVYPNEPGGNLLTGKKTNKKFANSTSVKESQQQSVSESSESSDRLISMLNSFDYYTEDGDNYLNDNTRDKIVRFGSQWRHLKTGKVGRGAEELGQFLSKQGVTEAKLDEEDVIIVPGQGNRIKPGFIPRKADRTDHEVEMALSDLFQSAKNAKQVYELIKDIPETVGIEGWVQEKIIKANDYLNTVREYLEHKQVGGVNEAGERSALRYEMMLSNGNVKRFVAKDDADAKRIAKSAGAKSLIKLKADGISFKNKIAEQDVAEGEEKQVQDRKTGKMYDPDEEFKKLQNDPEYIDQMKRMGREEGKGWPKRKDEGAVAEGYRILPNIDRERYQEREGLEGPFRARNGKVYYYDPKAGLAYDPDTDFYIDYDELKMMDTEMSEGIVGKVLGGAALLAALWGIGQQQANQVYSNSPQLQTLIKYHQMATQQGDQAKIQELERRIENHKTRLSLGKGEVMGSDDKPIVPSFESSIMKGIQNEQSSDKRDFKRREMEHELGHETNNHAVMIDGKIWKVFADKRQAENIARSLRNKGKKASVGLTGASVSESQIPDKCPDCGGKLVAESELNEEGNKDACYHKVKSRYKVWPSAYASGALVKCRKVGASNWGDKKK
jgi:hypothetical protein